MIDKIISLLKKNLTINEGVNSLVEQRVYPTHLSARYIKNRLSEDNFPCITIHYEGSKKAKPFPKSGWFRFLIQSWSNTEQSICYDVYNAIIDAVEGHTFSDTNYRITIYEDTDQGILSEKTDAGVRHWHSVYYKIFAVSRN